LLLGFSSPAPPRAALTIGLPIQAMIQAFHVPLDIQFVDGLGSACPPVDLCPCIASL